MQFMERCRITIAFGIALVVHAGVMWWWAGVPIQQDSEPATKMDLVLTQVLRPDEPEQPDEQAQDSQVSEVVPEPIARAPSEPEAISEPTTPSETTLPQLDLTQPENWAEVAPMPGTAEDFARAFRGEFYQRLEQRQTAQARSQLLAGRRVVQRGLSAEQYNALEKPGSGHVKTDAGCFDLKPDIFGTIAGGQRIWMTACKDLVRTPFELPSLEFDALGRTVVP